MWPFGVSKQWVNEAIETEIKLRMGVHEGACHDLVTCPICNSRLLRSKRVVVETPWEGELMRAMVRASRALIGRPYPDTDETLTFACGTKRIRKDGKVRVVAACLRLKDAA